jgi:hypothetical protein
MGSRAATDRPWFSNQNEHYQHSKEATVNKSFSRRLGGYVSHTRQGVVSTPQGLI